jgi:hypothetical protein
MQMNAEQVSTHLATTTLRHDMVAEASLIIQRPFQKWSPNLNSLISLSQPILLYNPCPVLFVLHVNKDLIKPDQIFPLDKSR